MKLKTPPPLPQEQSQIAQIIRQITLERAGPDATDPATGTDPTALLAGTPAVSKTKALPPAIPADLSGTTEDHPPSGSIKTASK